MEDNKYKWYIIYTTSGYEDSVAELLQVRAQNAGLWEFFEEIYIPKQKKVTLNKKGEKVEVYEKPIKGYILVKMILNDHTWPLVRDTQGVVNFVGTGKKPIPISDQEVQKIKGSLSETHSSYKINFAEGDLVQVISGDLKDSKGKVVSINHDNGKVQLLLFILGREVPVELDVNQISKI